MKLQPIEKSQPPGAGAMARTHPVCPSSACKVINRQKLINLPKMTFDCGHPCNHACKDKQRLQTPACQDSHVTTPAKTPTSPRLQTHPRHHTCRDTQRRQRHPRNHASNACKNTYLQRHRTPYTLHPTNYTLHPTPSPHTPVRPASACNEGGRLAF